MNDIKYILDYLSLPYEIVGYYGQNALRTPRINPIYNYYWANCWINIRSQSSLLFRIIKINE